MKAKSIAYWVSTALLAFALAPGGVSAILRLPSNMQVMNSLGYPPYFSAILGVWKVLGALALLIPRFPRLKEWAYAGVFFDLTGASASWAFTGGSAGQIAAPLVGAASA